MTKETFTFQAEVGKILDIVAHSLYSEKEVFLRELISNASDACDKLRYAAISDSSLNNHSEFKIEIEANKKDKILILKDNGIEAIPTDNSPLKSLVDELPFNSEEEIVLHGKSNTN